MNTETNTQTQPPAPLPPATCSVCPICSEPDCMGNKCSPEQPDDDDEVRAYDEWITELAEQCQSDCRPCPGCQQGGICDGANPKLTGGHA